MECENCGGYISEWAADWSICWRCKEEKNQKQREEDKHEMAIRGLDEPLEDMRAGGER